MAKRKIIWSSRAKYALMAILDYYFKRNGTKIYSTKLNSSLRSAIRLLESHPELGVKSDIRDVRVLNHGDYAIFYELTEFEILLITIWDNRQDPQKLNIDGK